MANLPPPPGLPPQPPRVQHRSFASAFSDPSLDRWHETYGDVLTRFNTRNVTHVYLYEQAVSMGNVLQGYLCCTMTQQQIRIYCLHSLSKFISDLDGRVTSWDGKSYAFLGELTHGMATTVEFPEAAFRLVPNIRVRTLDYIQDHWDEVTNLGMPYLPADEPDTTVISTRNMMYVPARYAQHLLRSSGYTPREVWDILLPSIIAENDVHRCTPLLNWLMVASTGTIQAGPPACMITLTAPIADQDLLTHRHHIMNQLLPALTQPPESFETAIAQMAAAVVQNTNEAKVARETKLAQATAQKLPSDKFTILLPVLQEYLTIADERDLPILWHQLANCKKRQEFNVLSELLQAQARGPLACSPHAPVVTPKLLQDLMTFTFVADSMDDIKTGLQPFIISDGSLEHRQANLELSRLYGFLQSGEQSIMLADLESIKAKEVQSIPLTFYELERNLGMFGNLLSTVLGEQHVLMVEYRKFWTLLHQGLRSDVQQIIDTKGYVKPAHILRSVQLICYTWFSQKRNRIQPPSPDFVSILYNITLLTYVLPNLPPTLYKLAYPRPSTTHNNPSGGQSLTSSSSGTLPTIASSSASSSASVVSGITLPTTLSDSSKKSAKILNLHPDTVLQALIPPSVSLKAYVTTEPPPLLDDGTQPCLSFIRGSCWSNCRRAQSHRPLTTPERTRIATYLSSHDSKPNPTATTSATALANP